MAIEAKGFTPPHWRVQKETPHLEAENIVRYDDALPGTIPLDQITSTIGNKLGAQVEVVTETTGILKVYSNGCIREVDAASYLSNRRAEFAHPTILVASRGVDYLMKANGDAFQVPDAMEILANRGDISDGSYLLLGPAAPTGKPAEVYDALGVRIKDGKAAKVRSVSKSISITEQGVVEIAQTDTSGRIILGQHTLIDLNRQEDDERKQPIVLKISGGKGQESIEAVLKSTMEQYGIRNGSFFLIANGGKDMVVNSAILKDLPQEDIPDLQTLKNLQLPHQSRGGVIQLHGHWTPHHPDAVLQERTGLTYQLHRHGLGEDGEGNPSGAHINGVIPDSDTVAYLVIKPIDRVFEVDAIPSNS